MSLRASIDASHCGFQVTIYRGDEVVLEQYFPCPWIRGVSFDAIVSAQYSRAVAFAESSGL